MVVFVIVVVLVIVGVGGCFRVGIASVFVIVGRCGCACVGGRRPMRMRLGVCGRRSFFSVDGARAGGSNAAVGLMAASWGGF